MTVFSYKAFLDEVRGKVDGLEAEELRELLFAWAKSLDHDQRAWFLQNLEQHSNPQSPQLTSDALFEQIKAFSQRMENEGYSEGWGWDDYYREERDWGDESWARELDRFFISGQRLVRGGQNEVAIKVYERVFAILDLASEVGLPGDLDHCNMLEVDLGEQLALFLRALYSTWAAEERPALLLKAMRDYSEYGGRVGLRSIIECADSPLPEQEIFLEDFLAYLQGQTGPSVLELTQETALLLRGPAGPLELARRNPAKYAHGYLTWLSFLESQGKKTEMLETAREALGKIPADLTVRAQIGAVIFKCGRDDDNYELMREGLLASFAAHPKLDYLVELYGIGLRTDQYRAIRQEVSRIVNRLRQEGKIRSRSWGLNATTLLTDHCFYHTLVLSGNYAELFALTKGHGSLGWSDGTNPKPLLLLLLLFLLAPGEIDSPILTGLWGQAISTEGFEIDQVLSAKYLKVLGEVYAAVELEPKTKSDYLHWCLEEVNSRVAAIVSNKYRRSYPKAAKLVAALAFTLRKMGQPKNAIVLLDGYHQQYSRYSAFRRELRAVT